MLSINNIEVVYDNVILVLKGVSLEVQAGAITTLLGANGAGKTTTLKAISGVLGTERGNVTKGSITFDDKRIDGMRPFDVTKLGISQVFEGRRVFEHLTTEENLIAGGHVQRDGRKIGSGIERVYAYFPLLKERRHQLSGYLSGGEQQMLAIGRALMSEPKVMLLDEPSLGLAPMLVEEIFGIVQRLVAQENLSVLLGRAERRHGAGRGAARLRHGDGPHRARRQRPEAARQLGHPRVLSRPQRGRLAQVLPRREALQAPQALALLTGAGHLATGLYAVPR